MIARARLWVRCLAWDLRLAWREYERARLRRREFEKWARIAGVLK